MHLQDQCGLRPPSSQFRRSGWGLRLCILKFPGDSGTARQAATLRERLSKMYFRVVMTGVSSDTKLGVHRRPILACVLFPWLDYAGRF